MTFIRVGIDGLAARLARQSGWRSVRHFRRQFCPAKTALPGPRAVCEALEDRRLLTNYFVALTGSDTTGTGSQANPWRTINHAVATVAAGSTVEVHTGIYREKVTLPYHSSTATTTITTDGSGPVTIEGSDSFTGTWTPYTASHADRGRYGLFCRLHRYLSSGSDQQRNLAPGNRQREHRL